MIEELKFPTELKLWKYELERLASKLGLELIPIKYTIIEFDEMSEIAATQGFPVVIPHWRNGQNALHGKKRYKYGMGIIYEMVINNNPAHAYLHHCNTLMTQKSVMAHVNGHVDLFTRNVYFKPTNRRMIDTMADYRIKFEQFVDEHGEERVKRFYDDLLSFEWVIDPNALYTKRRPSKKPEAEEEKEKKARKLPKRIQVPEELPGFLDDWLNPTEWLEEQKKQLEEEDKQRSLVEKGVKVPPRPMQDILEFLYYFAPLEKFEKGIIGMVRSQSYYFAPMARTKLMHEGWASLIEEMLISEPHVLQDSEVRLFAIEMAGVQKKTRQGINPYRLGYDLLKDVWFRWDTGRHGDCWERCEYQNIKDRWDEFAIFKNLLEDVNGNLSAFAKKWREFSAFSRALRSGKLVMPAEFFIRDMFTKQFLVPTWLKYLNALSAHKKFSKMLAQMRPLEKEARRRLEQMSNVLDKDLSFIKSRKDVYAEHKKPELYLWSEVEVKAELRLLKALLSFEREFKETEGAESELPIPEEWFLYAAQLPGKIEFGKGKEKILEVTATYDDLMLIDEFFTRDFCLEQRYFFYKAKTVWDWDNWPKTSQHYFFEGRSFERIKRYLLFRYTNFYQPIIKVVDGNYSDNGELYLKHDHKGVDLDYWSEGGMHVKDVLERLYKLWGRAVYLETIKTRMPEERPWWHSWHQTEEKSTGELEELKGTRVICRWGPSTYPSGRTTEQSEYTEREVETVKFPAPF